MYNIHVYKKRRQEFGENAAVFVVSQAVGVLLCVTSLSGHVILTWVVGRSGQGILGTGHAPPWTVGVVGCEGVCEGVRG